MSFILHQGARTFFRAIIAPPKFLMFDAYYCCLMAGLDARLIGSADELEGEVFVNGYPDDFRAQAEIIAGLLLDAELDRKDIQEMDKSSIEREMVKLIDPTSATRLNIEGNKLLNLYAAAGFRMIQERMLPPANVDEFVVAYHAFWHRNNDQN